MAHSAPWAVSQDFGLIVRVLDGEWLVFHCGSGDTHRLSPEAGFVFGLLWNGKIPLSEESLLSQAGQSGFDRLDSQSLGGVLQGLSALSLVKNS